ncbi:alpha/beta hydrolase [Candidatus Saccharibacteria bacterium]|nr:MAG: alpha/beta hydrolase [Candidatus Saccharibacteria bacterium]
MNGIQIDCTGYAVAADWYDGGSTDKILLSLNGYSAKKSNQVDLVSSIVAGTGMSALVFDYSGHGESPFRLEDTRPAQHFLEVIYVFDWLHEKYPEAEITVMGTSYGGFLATQLTKYRVFANLILRAPAIYKPSDFYTTWRDIDRDWTRNVFRKDVEALMNHPLLARASRFAGRTFVMIHEHDEYVPAETTDAFIKTFSANTYLAEGFWHALSDPRNPKDKFSDYQKAISNWINHSDTSNN